MRNLFYYQTSIGKIAIAGDENYLTNVYFENEPISTEKYELRETENLRRAYLQLQEYLRGERQKFCLPLNPCGTSFYRSVWECLLEIPYGERKSYKEIAISLGKDKACRAVGSANNKNPLPIFIPCHRVVGSKGALIGYRGGLSIKEKLLELEKINKQMFRTKTRGKE